MVHTIISTRKIEAAANLIEILLDPDLVRQLSRLKMRFSADISLPTPNVLLFMIGIYHRMLKLSTASLILATAALVLTWVAMSSALDPCDKFSECGSCVRGTVRAKISPHNRHLAHGLCVLFRLILADLLLNVYGVVNSDIVARALAPAWIRYHTTNRISVQHPVRNAPFKIHNFHFKLL